MSDNGGIQKIPRRFPNGIPQMSPEEAAAFQKEMQELEEQNHKSRIINAHLEFFTDARLRLEKGEKYVRAMNRIIDQIHDEMQFLEHSLDTGFSIENASEELEKCFVGLAAQVDLFHFALADETLFPCNPGSLYAEHFAETNEKIFQSQCVKCCVHHGENDVLLVQLPPLYSQYENYQKASGGYPFPTSHLAQYSQELKTQLRKIRDELPRYLRYHFAYLHVYNEPQAHVIDNDNRDTKQSTDTICLHLGITDNPLTVSFSNRTIVTKKLTKGSYVFITEEADQWPKLSTMVSVLEQYFGA